MALPRVGLMSRPAVKDVPRTRGHAWRGNGQAKSGRVVPVLARGPGETATRVYEALSQGAPVQQRRRLPEVVVPVGVLAVRARVSTATVKRSLGVLERAGWLRRSRLNQPGRRGGRLRGRCRFELVMPAEVAAARNVGSRNVGGGSCADRVV